MIPPEPPQLVTMVKQASTRARRGEQGERESSTRERRDRRPDLDLICFWSEHTEGFFVHLLPIGLLVRLWLRNGTGATAPCVECRAVVDAFFEDEVLSSYADEGGRWAWKGRRYCCERGVICDTKETTSDMMME